MQFHAPCRPDPWFQFVSPALYFPDHGNELIESLSPTVVEPHFLVGLPVLFVPIHRAEGTNAGLCPRNAEDGGQQPRRRLSVPGWNYRVVKLNACPGLPYREQWVAKVVKPDVDAVRPDAAGGRSAPARYKTSFIWPPCYAQQPFSNCMGGHLTLAKEQNTQQSPANGLSILRHPLHS